MFGFNKSKVKTFCKSLIDKTRYGLTEAECVEAINETCAFFNIPAPKLIDNVTNNPKGSTCIYPMSTETLEDDILCYNLKQLKKLHIDDKESFMLVMTHECAHRVFQNQWLPGPDMGQWSQELLADFCLAFRSGWCGLNIDKVRDGLSASGGSGTHPTGKLRHDYMGYGLFEGRRFLIQHKSPTINDCLQLFLEYRKSHYKELREAELKIY